MIPDVLVAIDGSLVAPDEAKVSVFDRGFVYGDGVFETLRTYRQKLFRIDDHMARLGRSAAVLGIELPLPLGDIARELESLAARAIEALRPAGGGGDFEIVVRLQMTRGVGPLGLLPRQLSPSPRVAFLMPYAAPPASLYEVGAAVVFAPTYRPSDAARGAKVVNYLESIVALRRAHQAGADEALIVNAGGSVVEGTTSNVFVIRDGGLVTPPPSSGALEGVTRKTVIEVVEAAGLSLVERDLRPDDVVGADEVFLTSTLRGVMPVGRVEGRELPAARPVTQRVAAAFASRVAGI